jgi:hypothetical protein
MISDELAGLDDFKRRQLGYKVTPAAARAKEMIGENRHPRHRKRG